MKDNFVSLSFRGVKNHSKRSIDNLSVVLDERRVRYTRSRTEFSSDCSPQTILLTIPDSSESNFLKGSPSEMRQEQLIIDNLISCNAMISWM